MNTDKKSTFAPQSNKNAAKQEKAPAFRVETGIRAGTDPVEQLLDTVESGVRTFLNRIDARLGTNI